MIGALAPPFLLNDLSGSSSVFIKWLER